MAGNRFISYIDDLQISLEVIGDASANTYAEYEYVDNDGSEFESTGGKGKRFQARAWFSRKNYTDWQRFEIIAEQKEIVHDLIHPSRGLIRVRILSWNINHDDRERLAIIDIVFAEQLQGDFEDKISPLIVPQLQDLFSTGQQAAIDSLAGSMVASFGAAASALVSRVLDPLQNITAQFQDQTYVIRQYVAEVEQQVNAIEGLLTDIEQPANTLISTIDYGTSLPGRVIGAIAATVDRYGTLVQKSVSAPYATLQSFYNGLTALRDAAGGLFPQVDIIRAQAGALLCADLYKTDNENRGVALTIEKTPLWTDDGEYLGAPVRPDVMSVNDLERTLYLVRSYLQQAIDHDRSIEEHAAMAAALLRHVNVIKLERERIVNITVGTSIPLLLLCHSRGLGYRAAERVMTINPDIKNPSFVQGSVAIYE